MKAWIAQLWRYVVDVPEWRVAITILGNLASGVVCGAFVNEITTASGLAWSSFYQKTSFYGLVLLGIFLVIFNRSVYARDRDVTRFADVDYCRAYMRSQLLPELADRYKKDIRTGSGGEIRRATNELKDFLK